MFLQIFGWRLTRPSELDARLYRQQHWQAEGESVVMTLLTQFTWRTAASVCLQMRAVPSTAILRRPSAAQLLVSTRYSAAAVTGVRTFADAKWGVINEDIRAHVVQLVSEDGKMQANVPFAKALSEARRLGLDLVQVSESRDRVVCRIFDAKKRLFTMKKAVKPPKPKQDKEVVFGVKIEVRVWVNVREMLACESVIQ